MQGYPLMLGYRSICVLATKVCVRGGASRRKQNAFFRLVTGLLSARKMENGKIKVGRSLIGLFSYPPNLVHSVRYCPL